MTEDGSLPDDVIKEEAATRAELTKVTNPPHISALFDYSITRKNYAQLKAAGWQPVIEMTNKASSGRPLRRVFMDFLSSHALLSSNR